MGPLDRLRKFWKNLCQEKPEPRTHVTVTVLVGSRVIEERLEVLPPTSRRLELSPPETKTPETMVIVDVESVPEYSDETYWSPTKPRTIGACVVLPLSLAPSTPPRVPEERRPKFRLLPQD